MQGDWSIEAVNRAILLADLLPWTFAAASDSGLADPSAFVAVMDLDGDRVGVPADVADPDSGDLTDSDQRVIVPDPDDNDAA